MVFIDLLIIFGCVILGTAGDSYDEFMKRYNSDITYVILAAGPPNKPVSRHVAIACEVEPSLTDKSVMVPYIKMYRQKFNKPRKGSNYNDDIGCLNCLIQNWVEINSGTHSPDDKIMNCKENLMNVKKYLGTNYNSIRDETIARYKVHDGRIKSFKYTNNSKRDEVYETPSHEYIEKTSVEIKFSNASSFTANAGVKVPLLSKFNLTLDASASYDSKKDWSETKKFEKSEKRVELGKKIVVPAHSVVEAWWDEYHVRGKMEFTVNFVEADERLITFRNYLRNNRMTLHQKRNGVHIDFSDDRVIVLRNVPVTELYTDVRVNMEKHQQSLTKV